MLRYIIVRLILKFRKLRFRFYTTNKNVDGRFTSFQCVVITGEGTVSFGSKVRFGVINSPMFYNTYAYVEPRHPDTKISFGNDVKINNNFSLVAEKSVVIRDNVLIGYNCRISDSNFHDLNPKKRYNSDPDPQEVIIGNNVFIGNDVTILKGVTIGDNSVIAAGSLVCKSFPENVIIGGVPAKLIKSLD